MPQRSRSARQTPGSARPRSRTRRSPAESDPEGVRAAAEETVDSAESCVRENPESAIWTTLVVGLLVGAFFTWLASHRREREWRSKLDAAAERLNRRLKT